MALALARREGLGERALSQALDALKQVSLQLGDQASLASIADELEVLLRRDDDLWTLQFVLFERGYLSMEMGRWEDAESRIGQAVEVNLQIADRGNEPLFLATLGGLRRLQGRYADALDLGRRAVRHAETIGHTEWSAWSELFLGLTLLDVSALAEAEASLEAAMEAAERGGARLHLVRAMAQLGWCRWLVGERAAASELAERARSILAETTCPPGSAYLAGSDAYLAVAKVMLASGDPERAAAFADPIVEASRRFGWVETDLGARTLMGRCFEARGMIREARALYREVAESASTIGLPNVELQARTALAISAAQDPSARGPERERALTLAERLSASVGDETLRVGFLRATSAVLAGHGEGMA
jgi:tetratricopeptide (TPR) repeat protein